jgi:hypothetical protein
MDTYKAKIKATINGKNYDVIHISDGSYRFTFVDKNTNNFIGFEITDDYRLKCNNEYLESKVTKTIKDYSVQYSTDDTYNKTPFSCLFDCFSQRIITFNVTIH